MKTDDELISHWNTVCDFTGLTKEETERLKSLLFERFENSLIKKRLHYEKQEKERDSVVVRRDSSQKSLSGFEV